MNKTKIFTAVIVIVLILLLGFWIFKAPPSQTSGPKDVYYCPMHPTFTSDKPGSCAICGMSLVKRGAAIESMTKKKILFYRNPMNPDVTSPVPMKDQMGMDYVPVYEEEKTSQAASGVHIATEKQQLIGVKKQKIEKRKLTGQILSVGIVAFDPDLFVAQEEYLQALKTTKTMQSGNLSYTNEQLESLIKASKRKLMLLGMSEAEIKELEAKGQPQRYLYLPENGTVWVYIMVYEYDMNFVKESVPVTVEAVAYPGEVFNGEVVSVAPILDRNNRTIKVRALVKDPANKLKPEMYVDAKINFDLGEKLAVPQEAILDSGTRKIVFVADSNDYFVPRDVTLGPKAQGYYEVLSGLSENETVVTSGNFLIDSESKLNAALNQMSQQSK